jgi:hypothetical protein
MMGKKRLQLHSLGNGGNWKHNRNRHKVYKLQTSMIKKNVLINYILATYAGVNLSRHSNRHPTSNYSISLVGLLQENGIVTD